MKTRQFWYPLPERLIAQHPSEKRGDDRMMVLHRDTGFLEHRKVADIAEYLTPDDLLVVNDTKVFPARLLGTWSDSPGAVEVLLVSPAANGLISQDLQNPRESTESAHSVDSLQDSVNPVESLSVADLPAAALAQNRVQWNAMIGSGRPSRAGQVAVFGPAKELTATLLEKLGGGVWRVEFAAARPLGELLDEFGRTPVPPYVKREGTDAEEAADRERYQTIYARHTGSVAAPTAGLHFTPEIFASLDAKGVRRAAVTLHVGPGTFRPVKADNIEDHKMDFEAFTIPPETADAINETKARGGRVVCVGSTTVRTLETVAQALHGDVISQDSQNLEENQQNGRPSDSVDSGSDSVNPVKSGNAPVVVAGSGASDIFIYPPYRFLVADAMFTNFHLPQSTLLMMTSAMAGRERMLAAYALAIRANYRFFSYGDAMLII